MKNNVALLFGLVLFILSSCGREKTVDEQMDPNYTACYRAIFEKDTAYLTIDTSKKQMLGFLKMIYGEQKKVYDGTVKGTIKGDTLMGHFDFKENKVNKWFRNPVAFLRKNGSLTMGVGQTVMKWGSPFFDEKVPIDYEKGRFIFELGECERKK
jgi:hypothetical protein